jgi:amino acid transporter
MGAALSGSRSMFALAEQGDIPRIFGHIHSTYRTPDVAIIVTCLTTLTLALTGSFGQLAAVSAIGRLLVYSGTCASVLRLRRQDPRRLRLPVARSCRSWPWPFVSPCWPEPRRINWCAAAGRSWSERFCF